MNSWKHLLWIGLISLAAACQTGPASRTGASTTQSPSSIAGDRAMTATMTATLAPGELAKFSGDTWAASSAFKLADKRMVEISWQYSGTGPFAVWLVNDSEDLEDAAFARILVKDTVGASSESVQYELIAGEYTVEIEQADGPWTVRVRLLP